MLYIPYPFVICKKCNIPYPPTIEFFYRNGKFFRVECRKCTKIYRDNTRLDKQSVNAYNRMRYTKRRDIESARKKIARRKNPEHFRDISRKSQKKHPITKRINYYRYQTRKQRLPTTFTETNWQYALEYFHGCCAVCGRPPGFWHTLAMDHWIPITSPLCIGTVPENIIPLCHGDNGCNNSKYNHDPLDWLTNKFGKHQAKQILDKIETYFQHIAISDY